MRAAKRLRSRLRLGVSTRCVWRPPACRRPGADSPLFASPIGPAPRAAPAPSPARRLLVRAPPCARPRSACRSARCSRAPRTPARVRPRPSVPPRPPEPRKRKKGRRIPSQRCAAPITSNRYFPCPACGFTADLSQSCVPRAGGQPGSLAVRTLRLVGAAIALQVLVGLERVDDGLALLLGSVGLVGRRRLNRARELVAVERVVVRR